MIRRAARPSVCDGHFWVCVSGADARSRSRTCPAASILHLARPAARCVTLVGEKAKPQTKKGPEKLFDTETEKLVLGTILRTGTPAYEAVSVLDVADFGVERHRIVFGAIAEVAPEIHPTVDAIAERLRENGRLDAAGGGACGQAER